MLQCVWAGGEGATGTELEERSEQNAHAAWAPCLAAQYWAGQYSRPVCTNRACPALPDLPQPVSRCRSAPRTS